MTNVRIGPGTPTVDTTKGTRQLVLRFTVTADCVYRRSSNHKIVALPYIKNTTLWLVPSQAQARPWLIDEAKAWLTTTKDVRVIG